MKLSTSIYDLVLIYVCHFLHHKTFLSIYSFSLVFFILSRYSCLHLGSLHPRIFCQVFTDFLLVFDHSAMKSMVYAKPTLCKYISRFNAESRAFSRKKWQADKNFAIPLKKCILQEKYGSIISKNHFNPFAPCFGHFYSFLDEIL